MIDNKVYTKVLPGLFFSLPFHRAIAHALRAYHYKVCRLKAFYLVA